MSRVARDFTQEISDIRQFLVAQNWEETKETSKFFFYSPPEELGIRGKFTVALPVHSEARGTDAVVNEAVSVLQSLYGHRFADLFSRIASKSEVIGSAQFDVRFVDANTHDGGIPLNSLKGFVEHVHRGLYQSAKLRLDGSSDGPSNPAAAEMADDARFLQTEVGSFIAKIEVPYLLLKQQDLFGNREITSHDVCSHLISGISFINDRILGGEDDIRSDDLLSESIGLFDPSLLEEFEKILLTPKMDLIEFHLQIGSVRRETSTGSITDDRISRLREFATYFREHFTAEDQIDVVGMIVELRSRDPAGNRNFIRLVADFYGDRTYFSVPLSNESYQIAMDAHRNKQPVRVFGTGIRLRTQVRIDHVMAFDIAGN